MKVTRALTLFLALALLGFVLLALSTPAARAADPVIVRVTTSGTTAWPCGQGNWSNPCALQTAFANAANGDEVWVAAGIYTPTMGITRTVTFQLDDGVAIYGGFAGGETVRTQRNFTANVTILSGDIGTVGDSSDNAYHVVTARSWVTHAPVLDGFTVTGGRADGEYPYDSGGGMYNEFDSNPTLVNVTFISNTAHVGGGMYSLYANPTLMNVHFANNSGYYGGGMSNDGGKLVLTDVTFYSNSAAFGGGMYNQEGSNTTLTNTTFVSNTASGSGGGMSNFSSMSTLSNVTFSGNWAQAGGGGMYNWGSSPMLSSVIISGNSANSGGGIFNDGIFDGPSSNPTIVNTTFVSNTASEWGGGMRNSLSSPTLSNVTFSGNWAQDGGGMLNCGRESRPTLTNTTFIGNIASTQGGGMYNCDQSSPTLTNVTLTGNAASLGGGMYNYRYSNPTVRNAIFWGNGAGGGSQFYNDTSAPNLYDSVVQDGCPAGSTCANIITTDPHLGLLGNWGGSTQTVRLLPSSSAIDAGNDATCAPTDQRGKARFGTCDVGAFEFQGYQLTKTGGDHQSTLISTPFAQSLQVTLTEIDSGLLLPSVLVTFTAPSSGASAAWSGSLSQTVSTNASGVATAGAPTANGIAGAFAVTANTAGGTVPVTFTLTNALGHYLPLLRR